MNILKKVIKYCFIFLVSIFLLIGITSFVVVKKIGNIDKTVAIALENIRKDTGYDIKIEKVSINNSFKPQIDVKIEKFIIYNPENKVVFKTKECTLALKILPLLRKKIVISNINLKRPIINIEYDNKSEQVFEIKPISFKGFEFNGNIDKILGENYKFKVTDSSTNKLFVFEGKEILLSNVDLTNGLNIKTEGNLSCNKKEYIKYDLDIYLLFELLKNSENDFSIFKTIYDYDFNGKISSKINLIKKGNKINAYGKLNADDFAFTINKHKYDKNIFDIEFNKDILKFNSVFNVSDNDNATLSGDLKFGDKKHLFIKSIAKDVNLTKLHEFYNVTAQVLNIKAPFNDYKVTGQGNFDFEINSDFKTLHSKGIATITNATVEHKNIPFKISNVNSKINFDNNKIMIQNASALINNNPITLSGNISDNVVADISINANELDLKKIAPIIIPEKIFIITDGKLKFNAKFKGQLNKEYTINVNSELTNVTGKDKSENFNLKPSNTQINLTYTPKTLSGNLIGNNLIFSSKKNKSDISLKSYNIKFDNNSAKLNNGEIKLYNTLLNVDLEANNILKDNFNTTVQISGLANANDLQKAISEIYNQPSSAKGSLPLKINIEYKNNNPLKLSAKIGADKNDYLSYAVIEEVLNKTSLLNIEATTQNDSLKIDDISLYNVGNIPITSTINTKIEKNKSIFSISGKISSLQKQTAENFKIIIPESLTCKANILNGIDASIKADIILNGNIRNPKIMGKAKFYKLYLTKSHTKLNNLLLKMNDNIINIEAPEIDISGTKFNAKLDILPNFKDKIEILNAKVCADNFNLNTLINSFGKVKSDEYFPGIHVPLNIKTGESVINNFQVDNIIASNISANFNFSNDTLYLSNVQGNAFGGNFSSDIQYNFLNMNLKSQIQGKNFDVNNLLKSLTNKYTDIQGKTNTQANFSMMLSSGSNQLKNIRGNAKFTLGDMRLGVFGQFERYLQAQNIVHNGIDSTNYEKIYSIAKEHNTSYFKLGNGEVTLEDGIINIEKILLHGKLMSLMIQGKHNMLNEYSNINLFGRISNAVLGEPERQTTSLYKEIPPLLDNANYSDSEFKVNIKGDIQNIRSINSFEWLSY